MVGVEGENRNKLGACQYCHHHGTMVHWWYRVHEYNHQNIPPGQRMILNIPEPSLAVWVVAVFAVVASDTSFFFFR